MVINPGRFVFRTENPAYASKVLEMLTLAFQWRTWGKDLAVRGFKICWCEEWGSAPGTLTIIRQPNVLERDVPETTLAERQQL